MATVAELIVALGVDSKGLDQGLGEVPGKLDRVSQQMVSSGQTLTRGVTLPLAAAAGGLFALAGAQEDAVAKLTSSFDSMGAAGWTTLDELEAQAAAFQEVTTFGDESILEFQSVLLTFGNVTGDVFTEATDLGLDMSAKLGTDLQSTAIQLGKALNDPVAGISALSRVGVSFTEDQKDMVKAMAEAGDIAGAQALILAELENQFGGTAEAMALTSTGQAKQAMNALGDAGESLGTVLLPVVSELAGWLKSLAGWFQDLSPEAKEWIVRIGAMVAAIGPLLIVGGKLIKGFQAISGAFKALSALMSANPYVLLIAATVALVTLIVMNWDKIKEALGKAWDWIKETASTIWNGISDAVSAVADFLVGLFLNWTLPGLIIKHWDTIKEAASNVSRWVIDTFSSLVNWFKELPGKLAGALGRLAELIVAPFKAAWGGIVDLYNSTVALLPGVDPIGGGATRSNIGGSGLLKTAGTVAGGGARLPEFHNGGIYRAPTPGGEGLAWLKDGEQVTPAGATGAASFTINVDARGNSNAGEIGEATARAIERKLRLLRASAQRVII